MRLIETDSLTDTNIATAVSIGSHTATAVGGVIVRVLVKGAAGNGDYIIYATITKSAQEYQIVPITTAPVASGRTAFGFVSLAIPVDVDDVVQVYIDGLAGDTATPDTRVDFYTYDYLRPTVAGRTLDVDADGSLNSVSGSVGSVSGLTAADVNAIKVVTDKLNTAMVLDGAVYQFTANALELAASGGLNAAQTGDAVLDEVVEGSYTLRQMMRLIAATLAGVSSGGGTSAVTFTGLDGSTPRIVATVDASGNRSAVTKTVT